MATEPGAEQQSPPVTKVLDDDAITHLHRRLRADGEVPSRHEIIKLKAFVHKDKMRSEKYVLDVDGDGNTALILSAKLLDRRLMKHFLNYQSYSLNGVSAEQPNLERGLWDLKSVCLQTNKLNENILTAGLKAGLERRSYDQLRNFLTYLRNKTKKLFSAEEYRGVLNELFSQKDNQNRNVLHIVLRIPFSINSNFCEFFLNFLKENEIWIDPVIEDNSKLQLTPFLYLMGHCPAEKINYMSKMFLEYCQEYESQTGQSIRAEDLLRNYFGLDIVHVRAMQQGCLVEDILEGNKKNLKANVLVIPHKKVTLYQNESAGQLEHNHIVLGGPIERQIECPERPGQSLKYTYWTALHFACKKLSPNIRFLVDNNFSLADTSATGITCAELAADKEELIRLLGIDEEPDGNSDNAEKNVKFILEFINGVDPIKCALDSCSEVHDFEHRHQHQEQICQMTADAEVSKMLKKIQQQQQQQQQQPPPQQQQQQYASVDYEMQSLEAQWKLLMLYCFQNDDVKAYRNLIHSSMWKKFNQENVKKDKGQEEIDKELVSFLIEKRESEMEKSDLPAKGKSHYNLKDYHIVMNRVFKKKMNAEPVLKYLNNGRIFLYELLKSNFNGKSLIEFAVRTGRPRMAKALILTRQMDLIPHAVHTIQVCSKLIEKENLLHYYPIMDANNDLKSVRAFASKVAMNAIDILFRGCLNSEAKMVFNYLDSKDDDSCSDPQTCLLPSFRLRNIRNGDDRKSVSYSTLELARNSQKVEFFATECFQQMIQRKWNKNKSKFNNEDNQKINDRVVKLINYLQAPRRKLLWYGIMNAAFISFLIVSLTFPDVNFNWVDVTLIIFMFSYIVQEIHECIIRCNTPLEGWKSYFFDIWNIYDQLTIIFLIAAFSLKLNLLARGDINWGTLDDLSPISKLQMLGQPFITNIFNYKMLLGTALLIANTKFLKLLRYLQPIGLNMVVMPTIFVKDLLPFTVILLLFIASFGSFFFATLTMGRYAFSDTAIVRRTDSVLFELYTRPLMLAFGEFQFDDLEACSTNLTSSATNGCYYPRGILVYKRFIIIVFLFVVNLVMFNMLIAKFSNTVSRYESRSRKIWLSLRDEILIDFAELTPLPPPLNIIGSFWILARFCFSRKTRSQVRNGQSKSKNIPSKLVKFYFYQALRFSGRRHEMQVRRVETIEDDIKERLNGEDEDNSPILKEDLALRIDN